MQIIFIRYEDAPVVLDFHRAILDEGAALADFDLVFTTPVQAFSFYS